MHVENLNQFYQYANCIIQIQKVIETGLTPEDCSRLQLLSISLADSENQIFGLIKTLLNIITSYLAANSQNGLDDILFEILFILLIMLFVLSLIYQELALENNQDFTLDQIFYILTGIVADTDLQLKLKYSAVNPSADHNLLLLNIKDSNEEMLNKFINTRPSEWKSIL